MGSSSGVRGHRSPAGVHLTPLHTQQNVVNPERNTTEAVIPGEPPVADAVPSVSTDQVAAFVELARAGSLRAAADALHLTEQGVRNRLVALEGRLGVTLYHKQRGPRTRSPLTAQGEVFLPQAVAFLDRARQ